MNACVRRYDVCNGDNALCEERIEAEETVKDLNKMIEHDQI